MSKKIAVYGSFEARVPVFQRYWKRRKDGVKQRYWKTTTRTKKAVMSGRYEFHGKGKDLYKAVVIAHRLVPRGFMRARKKGKLQRKRAHDGIENCFTRHKYWLYIFVQACLVSVCMHANSYRRIPLGCDAL